MDTIQAFEAPSLLLREPKRRSAGQAISSITNYYTQYLIRKHPPSQADNTLQIRFPVHYCDPICDREQQHNSKLTLLLGWSIS